MNDAKRIAFLGAGDAGAKHIAGWSARLSAGSLTVYVPTRDAIGRAKERVRLAMADLDQHSRTEVEFSTDMQVQPDTDLVLVQLPKSVNHVGDRDAIIRRYLQSIQPTAVVLHYTASFVDPIPVGTGQGIHGLFHFSNPAHILDLMEIGLPGAARDCPWIKDLLRQGGFYPLIQDSWLPGFLSTRFQVRLLLAVEEAIVSLPGKSDIVAMQIDEAIRNILEAFRVVVVDPQCSDVLREVEARLLKNTGLISRLWEAFLATWTELKAYFSEREIALGLLSGPALRCIVPGFLRTVDIEGIPAFVALATRFFPQGNTDYLEGLIARGRIGGHGHGYTNPGGFYTWDAEERTARANDRNTFLLQYRLAEYQ